MILIHGLGLNRRMWQWQLSALAPHFRVISYDLLGHGESDRPQGPYELQHMVDQLSQLYELLDVQRAALIGFSLGGMIAPAFTLQHPNRVAALVILNSAHGRSDEQRAAIMERVRQAATDGPAATVNDALERWFSSGFAASNPQLLDTVRNWVLANDRDVYPALYEMLAHGDIGLEETIAAIQCPTLVITGEEDVGNSPEMAQRIAGSIPGARCEILQGLRHMALVENPQAVNSLIVPFLRENSQQPG